MDTIDKTYSKEIAKIASDIELDVLTTTRLADAIRGGCDGTEQAYGWGTQGSACALTAAAIYVKAHNGD